MNALQKITNATSHIQIPDFKAGDAVKVYCKIIEGEKERVQIFEGIVIKRQSNGMSSTFIVRKISYGIGVERIFPLYSSTIEKIEVLTIGKVRRAKLYYLRNLSGKKARITEVQKKLLVPPPVAPQAAAAEVATPAS